MASKTNRTPDGKHVQFGDKEPTATPPGFDPGDEAGFCPNWFGRTMVNPDNGGFGSAYIDPDQYDD